MPRAQCPNTLTSCTTYTASTNSWFLNIIVGSIISSFLTPQPSGLASAQVNPEERRDDGAFDASYTRMIVTCVCISIIFCTLGIAMRIHCTQLKGRTSRGIITHMLLPEDELAL